MAVQQAGIDFIQQAGAALSAAREALANDFQQTTAAMTAAILASPAGRELDAHFAAVKAIAQLAHELAALDDRLKDAYFSAVSLKHPLVHQGTANLVLPKSDARPIEFIEEATEVSAKTVKRPAKRQQYAPQTAPETKASTAKKRVKTSVSVSGLSANEQKALAYLRLHLNSKRFASVNGRDVGEGAGLPKGSVSFALRQLCSKGVLIKNEAGLFKLA